MSSPTPRIPKKRRRRPAVPFRAKRIFVRKHPELWDRPLVLTQEMRGMGFWSKGTWVQDCLRTVRRLVAEVRG